MLRWAIIFAIIAIIAGALGFGTLSDASATIAKVFAFIFLALFVIAIIAGRRVTGGPTV